MKTKSNSYYIQIIYSLLIGFITLRCFLNGVSTTVTRILELIMLSLIIYYYIKCKPSIKFTGKFINIILIVLFIWSFFIIWRGNWSVGIKQAIFNIIDLRGVSLYLLPFLLFLPYDIQSIKKIFYVFFYSSLLSFPLWLINIDLLNQAGSETAFKAEGIAIYLPFLAAFLMMYSPSFNWKKNIIIKIVFVIYLMLMLLNARRNVCFSLLCYGLIAYYIHFHFINKRHMLYNIILLLFATLTVLLLINNVDDIKKGSLSYMSNRINQDTRSEVEALFIYDFNKSPITDWIFGRGMHGTYYQERINSQTNLLETDRSAIETGYLDIILKGGIIYVLLIIIILVTAIWKGLRSGKMLGVSCGLFLTTYMIDLYSTCPISIFSIRAILFWFCISICYRKERYIGVKIIRRLKNKWFIDYESDLVCKHPMRCF